MKVFLSIRNNHQHLTINTAKTFRLFHLERNGCNLRLEIPQLWWYYNSIGDCRPANSAYGWRKQLEDSDG